jgi:hypothetical protein
MMPGNKLTVPLTAREDRDGNKFHVGRIKFPGTIDCKDGVTFLVFTSEEGNEEIQIAGFEPDRGDAHEHRSQSDRAPRPPRNDFDR